MSEMEYVFPGAYGGAVKSPNPPQIHALMKLLREDIASLAAERKPGVPFVVRGAKELNQKLAEGLTRLNMTAPVIAEEITQMDPNVPGNANAKGNVIFRTLVHCKATVRLIAPDTSFIDMVGSGHGGDQDDKAGGKASTYAWKNAVLKGLTIPHEDMVDTDDESTVGQPAARTPSEPAQTLPATGAGAGPNSKEDLEKVLAIINKAESKDDLEAIRKALKDGTLSLHGQARLSASVAFTKKMAQFAKPVEPDESK